MLIVSRLCECACICDVRGPFKSQCIYFPKGPLNKGVTSCFVKHRQGMLLCRAVALSCYFCHDPCPPCTAAVFRSLGAWSEGISAPPACFPARGKEVGRGTEGFSALVWSEPLGAHAGTRCGAPPELGSAHLGWGRLLAVSQVMLMAQGPPFEHPLPQGEF